jgi:hypothetical protein
MRKIQADIYHFHDPELLPAALIAKLAWNKHVVFDAHEDVGLIMLKDWLPSWLRPLVHFATSFMDKILTPRMDAVVTPTRLLYDKYKHIAQRTGLFRNFPAPEFSAAVQVAWNPSDQRDDLVVHLGTLSAHRLSFLLKVAIHHLEKHPSWRWTFIGLRDDQLIWMRQRIPSGLTPRIQILGAVPHLEVAALCCRASIGVNFHPLSSQSIQRAIPLKVFEYLSCGLCVLTTKVPLLMELVQDCPAVFSVDENTESLLDGLDRLVSMPDRQGLCDVARHFAKERFNCETEASTLSNLYQQIMVQQ